MSKKGRGCTFFCVLMIAVTIAGPVWGMSRKPPEPAYVEGQVVIKFKAEVSAERISRIVKAEKGTVGTVLKRSGLHLVILPEGLDVMEAVGRYELYPEVLYAEPNYRAQPLDEK